ncbi:hypothetical protein UPYG_G00003510 [Umbra pygmaea]|uniref:BAR domain-containing protein n=1 Tax=Umbra pygmaea TaxID=75934 RepID=A0ABD0XJG5_UMBPY
MNAHSILFTVQHHRKGEMMAEDNSPKASAVFAKRLQRQLSRGKEKVLQKFGKSVETKDASFEQCLQNLNDQQSDGHRLYKDLRTYLSSVKGMRDASKRLSESMFDLYESDWEGFEDVGSVVEGEDLLWNDYESKLLDQALRTMESYISQFPDVKEKVAKRGRKLVDYDSSRHRLEALQNAKKKDDVKTAKATEEVNKTRSVFEELNRELKEELPVLYDSRIGCYVAVFTAISSLRDTFFKESTKFNSELQNVLKELKEQHPDKEFVVKGLNRTTSLKRRSLMSPKSWKASFSDYHSSYSPGKSSTLTRGSSFRSPLSPRSDESFSSLPTFSTSSLAPEETSSKARDANFTPTEDPATKKKPESESRDDSTTNGASGSGQMSEEEEKLAKDEKEVKEGDPGTSDQESNNSEKKKEEHSAALTASTPQVTNAHNSEGVELQSQTIDSPQPTEETTEEPGVQNGAASNGSDSDIESTLPVQKAEQLYITEQKDLKNTELAKQQQHFLTQLVHLRSFMMTSVPTEIISTTSLPTHTDNSVLIGVVIGVVLVTLAALAFILYRYFCHDMGAYRTTGEHAPGEEPDQGNTDSGTEEKKEYFI